MKLRNLLLAAGAARLSYLAVTHRKKILSEAKETQALLADIEKNKNNIQEQLAIIQSYRKPLKDMTTDLQYKLRVYQQSISGNLNQIKNITKKYTPTDEKK